MWNCRSILDPALPVSSRQASPMLRSPERSEFIDGNSGQFAVGKFEQDGIAIDLVVEITAKMHAVAASLRADNRAASLRRPIPPAHGDGMLDFDPVAGFQFVKESPIFVRGSRSVCGGSSGHRFSVWGKRAEYFFTQYNADFADFCKREIDKKWLNSIRSIFTDQKTDTLSDNDTKDLALRFAPATGTYFTKSWTVPSKGFSNRVSKKYKLREYFPQLGVKDNLFCDT
jgi:hypothetical protein